MIKRHFSSDWHFGHTNILRLSNRPFASIQHHNEMLIKNFNERVGLGDELFCLGDVALGTFADSIQYVKRLHGFKVLVPGNHDRISSVEKASRRERFLPDYENVFRMILPEVTTAILAGGIQVMMSHYPYDGDSHDGDRFTEIRPVDKGMVLLHGHTHSDRVVSRSKQGTLQIHVGVDSWNYRPASEDEIIKIIKENV